MVTKKSITEMVEYAMSYYGPDGMYQDEFVPFTRDETLAATMLYACCSPDYQVDTFAREQVCQIVLYARNKAFLERTDIIAE